MGDIRKLAIVGIGPRGLFSLENLVHSLNKTNNLKQLKILLFEETKEIGNGPVYGIHQSKANWINISERILLLEERAVMNCNGTQIPSFPTFHKWTKKDFADIPKDETDIYPLRSYVGEYLKQRFDSLFEPLNELKIVSLVNQRVDKVEVEADAIILQTNENDHYSVDEVLLTIGHQPTRHDDQIKNWSAFTDKHHHLKLFVEPYPIKDILSIEQITPKSTIALRGFGLAMIDVVRAIAEKFGEFTSPAEASKGLTYQTDAVIKNLFVPFSLDGLPMSPKPINAQIDEWFRPSQNDIAKFEEIIGDRKRQQAAKGAAFLIDAIAPILAKVYLSLPQVYGKDNWTVQEAAAVAIAWLKNGSYQHVTILPRQQPVERTLLDFVQMASGKDKISFDFCIGQVWRHCQPSIYKQLSFNECAEEVFAEIIELDERMKRYAYGPPVESIQQLIALIEAGIMNLSMLHDPDIDLTEEGWIISCNQASISAKIMINTVLDSPRLEAVSSPIIKHLLSNDLIQAVHDDLGVFTDENGYVISNKDNKVFPIALLGRLAKGTIIGVDAILECFGSRPKQWASKAAERHIAWITKR